MPHSVNYDLVAPAYDQRYERNRFDGVEAVLWRFIGNPAAMDIAEVGCGTGHWLARLCDRAAGVAGLDPSSAMLQRARMMAPSARLIRGRAEHLPWTGTAFDRVFCINALHHFEDAPAFIREARRVIRPGGALMTIGLDPHAGLDQWWIYDYFPGAREADSRCYRPTGAIRRMMDATGFIEASTEVAQHFPAEVPFAIGIDREFSIAAQPRS